MSKFWKKFCLVVAVAILGSCLISLTVLNRLDGFSILAFSLSLTCLFLPVVVWSELK